MKKIATITGSVALFAATIIPAMAANNCSNGTTGPFSTNYCTENNTTSATFNNTNDAQSVRNINISVTENNSASKNTLGGSVVTGNKTVNVTLQDVLNVNTNNNTSGWAGTSNTGRNDITGPESDNQIYIQNANNANFSNSNTASVDTRMNLLVAEQNAADMNTGGGMVDTGEKNISFTNKVHANDNLNINSVRSGGNGVNVAANDTTGPYSTNYITLNNSVDAMFRNVNDMVVNTDANIALLENNSASTNTLPGTVVTGNTDFGVLLDTEGNLNYNRLSMAMGAFGNTSGNDITGPGADNQTNINNYQSVVFDNWNNKCMSHNADRLGCDPADLGIFNNVNYTVASNNVSDMNTGGGEVLKGDFWGRLDLFDHLNDSFNVSELL